MALIFSCQEIVLSIFLEIQPKPFIQMEKRHFFNFLSVVFLTFKFRCANCTVIENYSSNPPTFQWSPKKSESQDDLSCHQKDYPQSVEIEDWTLILDESSQESHENDYDWCSEANQTEVSENISHFKSIDLSISTKNQIHLDSVRIKLYQKLVEIYGEDSPLVGYSLEDIRDHQATYINIFPLKCRTEMLISTEAYKQSMLYVTFKSAIRCKKYIQSMFDIVSVFFVPFVSSQTIPTSKDERCIIRKSTKIFKSLDLLYSFSINESIWDSMHRQLLEYICISGQDKRIRTEYAFANWCTNGINQIDELISLLDKLRMDLHATLMIPFYITVGVRLFCVEDSYTWLTFVYQSCISFSNQSNCKRDKSLDRATLYSILNVALGEIILEGLHILLQNQQDDDDCEVAMHFQESIKDLCTRIDVEWLKRKVNEGMLKVPTFKFA